MNRPPTVLWLAILLILLLPTAAGRVLLDVVGGVALVVLTAPLVLGGLGWVAWKVMQSRLVTCPACGTASVRGVPACPACGTSLNSEQSVRRSSEPSVPASDATIDITAQDVGSDS